MENDRCRFLVWAPYREKVEVHVTYPDERMVLLEKDGEGYHRGVVEGIKPGFGYLYRLDGKEERPDPASRFQPGPHVPSRVPDPLFPWADRAWFGIPLQDYLIYELHVGTFTPEGTFDGVISRLDYLKDLGVTAIEIMPVAQFPGSRNWGYDGVYPFAVQDSYGGPIGLKELVNACHGKGLAVILDVVYNHLGPEGNYLRDFGPYFTDRYHTPWGEAINFDGPESDHVRRFFIENALYWVTEFHMDALRLDAVHAILDHSAFPFLEELGMAVHERARRLNRRIHLMPESASNDSRIIRSRELGGMGLDCQWNDDFHHALHSGLTGEQFGYYNDFGNFKHIMKAFNEGFVYSGEYSDHRQRRHGNSSRQIPAHRFVVFIQNHDQVGNRLRGDRLSELVSFEGLKLAAGAVLLSPYIPLLFMGEEYGEKAPFPYFISHSDPDLVEAVRKGRKEEFSTFQWKEEPPDPQAEETFLSAKLNHELQGAPGRHKVLFDFYRELIRLRKETESLSRSGKEQMEISGCELQKILFIRRWSASDEVFAAFNFSPDPTSTAHPLSPSRWEKRLDSAETRWEGPGSAVGSTLDSGSGPVHLTLSPFAFVLFSRNTETGEG
jgi:maltooligosyltrehalose trehalohydrolase